MGSAVNQKDLKIESQKMDGSDLPSAATTKTSSKRSGLFGFRSLHSAWVSFCNWLHHSSEKLFGAMGENIGNHPFATIAMAIFLVGLFSIGFLWFNSERRSAKIFVPQNSKSQQDLDKASKFFKFKLRQEKVIIAPKQGENIIDPKCLKEVLQVHLAVENLTGYADVCSVRPGVKERSREFCMAVNPLELFNYNAESMVNIKAKLSSALNCPGVLMRNGRPSCLNFPKMFSGLTKNESSNEILSAQALQITWYVDEPSSDKSTDEVKAWEESFIEKLSSLQDELSNIEIYISAEKSLDDAVAASSSSDIRWFSLTFTLLLTFASVMLGKIFTNPLTGHTLLALGGTFAVALGILAGFSLSMLAQTPFVSIVGVLPFLVVGIGVDDMFIIVDHLDRQERQLKVPTVVRRVMSGTGVTITMTTLTDLVAFAVSTNSQFPSIQYFCTYAALTITFSFLMIVTVFVAMMSFDVRRIKANRRNCLPMCYAPEPKEGQPPWDEPKPQVSNRLMKRWAEFLMHPTVKAAVVLISLCLLGGGIYATIHVDQEFDRSLLAKEGSYFDEFVKMDRKYFELPMETSIVLIGNVEYGTVSVQNEITDLSEIVDLNKYFEKDTVTWMGDFLKYCKDHNKSCDGDDFMASLKSFLSTSKFSYYNGDIKFGQNETVIEASRITAFMKRSYSSVFKKDAMLSMRKDLSAKSKLPVFVAAPSFVYLEQYAAILSETIRNLTIAALAVLVVTAPFLINLSVSFLVFVGFVSLIFELFGMMWLLNVSLNSISMINLVMAIGFAVDYSAHIAHAFVKATDTSADKRVVEAVTYVGASVMLGGASTLIGISMIAFSKSKIFQIFFKMFFSMVLLGLLHGLCFLPVHLSVLYNLAASVYKRRGSNGKQSEVVPGAEGPGTVYCNPTGDKLPLESSAINQETQKDCRGASNLLSSEQQLNGTTTKDNGGTDDREKESLDRESKL